MCGLVVGDAPEPSPEPVNVGHVASKIRNIPRDAEVALNKYSRETKKLTDEYAEALQQQHEQLVTELRAALEAIPEGTKEQRAVQDLIADLTGDRQATDLLPQEMRDLKRLDLRRQRTLQPGLVVFEYPRHPEQDTDEDQFYIDATKLGARIGESSIATGVNPLTFNRERNAIAFGFLKIDEPGEYAFRSDNYYDRNMLYVDGQLVCKFRDGETTVNRIILDEGLVPIVCVGLYECRGEIKVTWQPPGARELESIPTDRLFCSKKY